MNMLTTSALDIKMDSDVHRNVLRYKDNNSPKLQLAKYNRGSINSDISFLLN